MEKLLLNGTAFEVEIRWGVVRRFDAAMRAMGGRNLWQIVEEALPPAQKGLDANEVAYLFFETVKGQHGIATIDDVDDFLDRHRDDVPEILRVLVQAVVGIYPSVGEPSEANGSAAEVGALGGKSAG